MSDTRTIYLHTGIETFTSDPTETEYLYLDMSDYDSLNPEYESTIKLSGGVTGIYESTKAKIILTFEGVNSGRDARAEWVNNYAQRINKISVSSTSNKANVFNKSASVSHVEFIDTEYTNGVQVSIEVTMFGRWQSTLSILDTVTETYTGGTKSYSQAPVVFDNMLSQLGRTTGYSLASGEVLADYSSDFISVVGVDNISLNIYSGVVVKNTLIIFYDADYNSMWVAMNGSGSVPFSTSAYGDYYTMAVPQGAVYVKISTGQIAGQEMKVKLAFTNQPVPYTPNENDAKNVFINGDFKDGWNNWKYYDGWNLEPYGLTPSGSKTVSTSQQGKSLIVELPYAKGYHVHITFQARGNFGGQAFNANIWGGATAISGLLSTEWQTYTLDGFITGEPQAFIILEGGGTMFVGDVRVSYTAPVEISQAPYYNYNYQYGKTTLLNQISLPKNQNRFMIAIDSNYTVATITLSANGQRASISTARLNSNSSISSDFVSYDITEFMDTDKFVLLTSGLIASVVWDNLASQYAVLYNIMNSVGDTPADIAVTTASGQHIPFKLYTYAVQDFI